MRSEEFVDAAVFLGMHSVDDTVRVGCASFFAERLDRRVAISLEQVGLCDDVVWGRSREEQDAYYPFMDHLHTAMDIARLGYDERDLATAQEAAELAGLPVGDRLSIAVAMNRGGTLYSLNPDLLARPGLPVRPPPVASHERTWFPTVLEGLYRISLYLRVDVASLCRRPCTEG